MATRSSDLRVGRCSQKRLTMHWGRKKIHPQTSEKYNLTDGPTDQWTDGLSSVQGESDSLQLPISS